MEEDDDGAPELWLDEAEAEAAAQLGNTAAEIFGKHRRSTSAESRQARRRRRRRRAARVRPPTCGR